MNESDRTPILFISSFQIQWGILQLTSYDQPILFTGSSYLTRHLHGTPIESLILITVAILAIYAALRLDDGFWRFLAFVPQQVIMVLSALSSITAVIQQHFADGVVRGWRFIYLDQYYSIGLAVMYTITILWPSIQRMRASRSG